MPRYALTPTEYDEISFVSAGANPDADIVLAKSATRNNAEGDNSKCMPDSSDMHAEKPLLESKTSGKKKKKVKEAVVYKLQAEVMSSVLDLGSDMLQIISAGGTRQDIAKLLQDHANVVSHEVNSWLDPEISKSKTYDPEHLESLAIGQKILSTVLAKAGSRSDDMPITNEERAGLPDTVKKYLDDLEAQVSKDEEELDDEYEVDVEYDDEEEEDETSKSDDVEKKARKPKIKRMKLVSGSKKTSRSTTSSGNKKFGGGGGSFGGFGKSDDHNEVLKSISDPAAQAIVKSLMDSQRDLLAEIEKGKEEKEVVRWVETAKAWTHLPGKPEDIGSRLRAVEKSLGEDAAKELAAQMEAAQTMAAQSNVFKSAGVGGGVSSDTATKIEKAVEAEIAKFKADGVSDEVAKAKAQLAVFEAHPEYYDEHKSGVK